MRIKLDPTTGLWCREDGAVLMPPTGIKYKLFRWTFGCSHPTGYRTIKFHGKTYKVHQIVCRAFNGLPPEGKSCVDHIDRCRANNSPSNLHWVSAKENADNQASVDQSIEKYGVRASDDKATYMKVYTKVYIAAHREEHNTWQRAYDAAKRAEKRAQGLVWKKGPTGKYGWYPRVRKSRVA